jgi:hypothetical protein
MKGCFSIAASVASALLLVACGKDPIPEYRIVYYPNKKNVKEEWSIIRTPRGDTLEQGVHKQYFWNGSTSQSEIWKQGKREGSAQAWYETGAVKWQKSYDGGKRQGTWRLFYKEGHPWITLTYDKDMLSGKVQVWDKTESTEPKEANYTNGSCVSGECSVLEAQPAPPTATPADITDRARTKEIIDAFLN